MSKKLLLIQSGNGLRKGLISTQSKYPPIGLGIVATLTPDDWEIEVINSSYEDYTNKKADLVGVTAYTSTAYHAYQVAEHFRLKNIPVVMGGIHATLLPKEASQYVDSVIIGEAEGSWSSVIKDFTNNQLKPVYKTGFCEADQISPAKHSIISNGYNLSTIQASRGCPFNCHYCSVTLINGGKVRLRPVSHIIKEWQTIENKFIWFADDNLFGYSKTAKAWAKELFKELGKLEIKKNWMCFAHVNSLLDEEALELAAESGCKLIYIGFESEDIESLRSMNKNARQINSYGKVISLLHKYGISILAGIMLGFDNDTPESIERRIDFVLESEIDSYFLSVVTPLPGTRFFDRIQKEGRLIYNNFPKDWEHYDWANLVHRPLFMSFNEAENAIAKAYEKAYSYSNIKQKYKQSADNLKSKDTAYLNYLSNMDFREIYFKQK